MLFSDQQLDQLRILFDENNKKIILLMRSEMTEMKRELHDEIKSAINTSAFEVKRELRAEIRELRQEMNERFDQIIASRRRRYSSSLCRDRQNQEAAQVKS